MADLIWVGFRATYTVPSSEVLRRITGKTIMVCRERKKTVALLLQGVFASVAIVGER
jgi:hypothetical protein